MIHKKVYNRQQYTKKHNEVRQTKPGLAAYYDIRSGNAVGLLLQPGACMGDLVNQMHNLCKTKTSFRQV